jgi:deltex
MPLVKGLRCPVEKYTCKNPLNKKCKHLCHCKFDVIVQEEDVQMLFVGDYVTENIGKTNDGQILYESLRRKLVEKRVSLSPNLWWCQSDTCLNARLNIINAGQHNANYIVPKPMIDFNSKYGNKCSVCKSSICVKCGAEAHVGKYECHGVLDLLEIQRKEIGNFLSTNFQATCHQYRITHVEKNIYSLPGQKLYNKFVESWQSVPNEEIKCMFHGTHTKNVANICKNGMDPQKRGCHGQAHGVGEYFGTSAQISMNYCKGKKLQMIVFACLMDNSGVSYNNSNVVVINKTAHQLPMFVVHFENNNSNSFNGHFASIRNNAMSNAGSPYLHNPAGDNSKNTNIINSDDANNCNKNRQNKRKRWLQNTDGTLTFRYEDSIDWARVTKWKSVYPPEYDPHAECIFDLQPMGDGVELGVVKLPCGHVFKKNVLKRWLDKHARCPLCYHYFNNVNGPQPSGTMSIKLLQNLHCSGSAKHGTYEVTYIFNNSIQGSRMKNPGKNYRGTTRRCYYPNTKEGNAMVELLKKAFMKGVLFVVGQSVSSGMDNCVIWGGIHQKTQTSGGPQNHGWPDPKRLQIMTDECKQNGVELENQLDPTRNRVKTNLIATTTATNTRNVKKLKVGS